MADTMRYAVLIIGAGRMGAFFDTPDNTKVLTHAHAFKCFDQFDIAGFVDQNIEKAQKASEVWGGKPFSSIDEVNINVDVVVICTPDYCHYEGMITVQKLHPRLIVLEKPAAGFYKEAEQIREVYAHNEIPVIVNYSRRFSPYFQKLKNDIDSGAYGYFLRGNGYYGKGAIHNGSHLIDIILYLLGGITGFEVFDEISDFTNEDKSVSAVIALKNGKNFTIQAIDSRVVTVFEIELFFEKKRIRICGSEFKALEYEVQSSPIFDGYRNYAESIQVGTGQEKCLQYLAQNVLDVLQGKENPISSLENACEAMRICEELTSATVDRKGIIKKRVLLFARDPGGANVIVPLIDPIKKLGHDAQVFAKDIALGMIKDAEDIMLHVDEINEHEIIRFLQKISPDFVVTATSADDKTEKFLWLACGKLNILSFVVLDQWMNHGVRFSKYGVSDIERFYKDRKLDYLPDKIFALDDLCKREMVEEGILESKIIVTGGTYIEKLLESTTKDAEQISSFRKGFNCDKLIVFASEPITTTYGDIGENIWGYTEKTIFSSFLDQLQQYTNQNICVIIRLHPRENIDSFNLLLKEQDSSVKLIIDKSVDKDMLIDASDLVVGMSSMFIIEAFLRGANVMSLQMGLCNDNPFVFHKLGILKSILDQNELKKSLDDFFETNSIQRSEYDGSVHINAAERIIDIILKSERTKINGSTSD